MEKALSSQTITILQQAIENDIISIDGVHDMIMASKRVQIKQLHPFKITPPNGKNTRWQTYYKDENGNRKIIRAQSEKALLDKLLPIYTSQTYLDKMTFHELFEEYLEYKKSITNSPNTIKRHIQHYRKYLEPSALDRKKIKQIDELLLELECNRIVKDYHLSSKEWSNVKTILNGMFEYAIRKSYLPSNLMDKIKISIKFRQIPKKTGKTETYNTVELKTLTEYLDNMYAKTNDSVFLAVKLNFLLGLRVGELAALKWDDLSDERHLHIVREEIRDQMANKYQIVDHTKTHTDRFVILIPKAQEIIGKIEPQGEYLFMRKGNRITSRQIAYVLEKYAERQGIATKSTHKMRKTYASNLNFHGVPLDCIREQLGHSNLQTTLTYIYNPLTESETYDMISNAL